MEKGEMKTHEKEEGISFPAPRAPFALLARPKSAWPFFSIACQAGLK